MPELIYSGGGNPRFYKIALEYGFKYGVQLPDTVYGPIYFADQNWKNPNRNVYMKCLEKHTPYMSTVLDLEKTTQLREVLSWAEEASQFSEIVQIIPKVNGIIRKLPKCINNKPILLGYSIPTYYGRTDVAFDEFKGWDIHLLGGSPNKQINYWNELSKIANVKSIDGNYFRMKATRFCEYWSEGKWVPDGNINKIDTPYIVFEKSCQNISNYWNKIKKK